MEGMLGEARVDQHWLLWFPTRPSVFRDWNPTKSCFIADERWNVAVGLNSLLSSLLAERIGQWQPERRAVLAAVR